MAFAKQLWSKSLSIHSYYDLNLWKEDSILRQPTLIIQKQPKPQNPEYASNRNKAYIDKMAEVMQEIELKFPFTVPARVIYETLTNPMYQECVTIGLM